MPQWIPPPHPHPCWRIANVTVASTEILIRMQYVSLKKWILGNHLKIFGHFVSASMFGEGCHFGLGLCSCPSHLNSLWPKMCWRDLQSRLLPSLNDYGNISWATEQGSWGHLTGVHIITDNSPENHRNILWPSDAIWRYKSGSALFS